MEELRGAEALVKQVGIPAQPKIVMDVYKEAKKKDASFKVIADMVTKDASLAARVIKVINSPVYGGTIKITSIQQALVRLGLQNFHKIVLTATLREVLASGGRDEKMEELWVHNVITARIAEFVSTWMRSSSSPSEAYMAGLFHDCAIPLLVRKFKQSAESIYFKHINHQSLAEREDRGIGINHATIGAIMAKSWGMSAEIVHAIKNHHKYLIGDIDDNKYASMWFVLRFSDIAANWLSAQRGSLYYNEMDGDIDDVMRLIEIDPLALDELGLDARLLKDLVIDLRDMIDLGEGGEEG